MPHLTPDTAGALVSRRFSIPVNVLRDFIGAIAYLGDCWAWEQFGALTPAECAQLMRDVLLSEEAMIGDVWIGVTASLPDGVLPFDGVQRNRVDYQELYSCLDAAFLDDADHFTLHEAAGRTLIVAGAGTGLTVREAGDQFGAETHTMSLDELVPHTHGYQYTAATPINGGVEAPASGAAPPVPTVTDSAGNGEPFDICQPSFVIKAGVWYR